MAEGSKEAGLRQAGSNKYEYQCVVPYNIDNFGYKTGLHIVTESSVDVTFTLAFFCDGIYEMKEIKVPPKGATFYPSDLVGELRFPTFLYIYSHKDSVSSSTSKKFWVTQFLFTDVGFSHITLESKKLQEEW